MHASSFSLSFAPSLTNEILHGFRLCNCLDLAADAAAAVAPTKNRVGMCVCNASLAQRERKRDVHKGHGDVEDPWRLLQIVVVVASPEAAAAANQRQK